MDQVQRTGELLAAWNRGDLDALLAGMHEEVVWQPATMANVEGGDFHGRDGFARFVAQWAETWETWDVTLEQTSEVGGRVLVLGHVRARGRASGLELDSPVAYLFELRDGLLVRGSSFFDHDEALAAAGAERSETL